MEGKYTLGIIGGGFMAHAIAKGAVEKGFLSHERVLIAEPNAERAALLAGEGFCVTEDNREAVKGEYLLFAVKPQVFPEVAKGLRGCRLPVSLTIMAGKTKAGIRAELGMPELKLARAMPNLPCSVGEGMTGLDCSELCGKDRAFAVGLFSSVGRVLETDEAQLNAVTAISGSGPAYVYLFLQALVKAGTEQGLSEEQAKALALQTVIGGARYAELSEKSLQELIAAVSSKGGTTVAALGSLEKDDFTGAVSRAVSAAVKRAEELSR